jgi:DDE domain
VHHQRRGSVLRHRATGDHAGLSQAGALPLAEIRPPSRRATTYETEFDREVYEQLIEVFLTIQGERHDLWRAVDQDSHVLDMLVQRRRNTVLPGWDESDLIS